jgi:hypothetical protein
MRTIHRFSTPLLFACLVIFAMTSIYHYSEAYLGTAADDLSLFNNALKFVNVFAAVGIAFFLVRWCCVKGVVFCVRRYPMETQLEFFSGQPEVLRRHLVLNSDYEFIKYAAIRHPNGCIFAVGQPGRHGDVMFFMDRWNMAGTHTTHDQGFVTSFGRFVDRVEGLKIAQDRRQIVHKHPSPDELYSEDCWPEAAT